MLWESVAAFLHNPFACFVFYLLKILALWFTNQPHVNSASIPLILYVDDDSDDFFFFQESLFHSGSKAKLVGASNGEEAIHYLLEITSLDELPSLIILDLNMPRWDGRQTLRYLKEHPPFTDIPVIILSTSENKTDREICERLGAVSYVQKPNHFEGYSYIVENCLSHMHYAK